MQKFEVILIIGDASQIGLRQILEFDSHVSNARPLLVAALVLRHELRLYGERMLVVVVFGDDEIRGRPVRRGRQQRRRKQQQIAIRLIGVEAGRLGFADKLQVTVLLVLQQLVVIHGHHGRTWTRYRNAL